MKRRNICKYTTCINDKSAEYHSCCIDCRRFKRCDTSKSKIPCFIASMFRKKLFELDLAYFKELLAINYYDHCFKKLFSHLSEKDKNLVIAKLI